MTPRRCRQPSLEDRRRDTPVSSTADGPREPVWAEFVAAAGRARLGTPLALLCDASQVPEGLDLETWLRQQCAEYTYDLRGVFRRRGSHSWPLVASDEDELEIELAAGEHLLPLPKEPAALANVLEVSIVDFLLDRLADLPGAEGRRGTERGYPDVEVTGPAFGGTFHAVDVKIAQRKVGKSGRLSANTQSRITLYTGNTYFRYPQLHWPGTFRPFQDYASHLDVIGLYILNPTSLSRVENLELLVQPPWRIASKQRSSTTREYIGAVNRIEDLRDGRGEFSTPEQFYTFWRRYRFRIGTAVQQQLDRLLTGQQASSGQLEEPPAEERNNAR